MPRANARESCNAFRGAIFPLPFTYPMASGTLATWQGERATEQMPHKNAAPTAIPIEASNQLVIAVKRAAIRLISRLLS